MTDISHRIAQELGVRSDQVKATVELLDSGATVPFVARYRKEATGGLDDAQLRSLEERLGYLRELDARREMVLKAIEEQGKLTDSLAKAIFEADTKTRLEDLYRPYVKKRRTKAQIARENGLEPLLDTLLADPGQVPEAVAAGYTTEEITVEDALNGAGHIFMERIAEEADLIEELRNHGWERGFLVSRVVPGKEQEGARFRDYFDHVEPLSQVPSHRALAMFRGQAEECLRLEVAWTEAQARGEEDTVASPGEAAIARRFQLSDRGRPADAWLARHARLAWRAKLSIHLDVALKRRLRDLADEEAIRVFGANLQDVLLAAPAGSRTTMGLDPGVRTGVKVAVINGQGAVVETTTVYPFPPRNQVRETLETLSALARKHQVDLVAIGNGTHSRETDALVGELMRLNPKLGLTKVVISEAGASVYSASALASAELPDLDVSLRGAVSIARRLQDPLAELVKIEPKAIGVGQYQHDVNQAQLARKLDAVVEDCVNAVGVDVNTASAPLLARVSGLGTTLAENIVAFRTEQGAFASRAALKKVPRLGAKAFEQAAGFLRIPRGKDPLDASAVHPEAYPVVRRIVAETGRDVRELIGDEAFLKRLDPSRFTDETFGEPTVRDILTELAKPGRDPRPEFRTAAFKEGVERLQDLQPGMVLEGTVTNVANFGAFVDIGVHQDGLVHISALSDRFIKDPRDVVRAGDVVKVKVMEVDLERKRIALSMRLDDEPGREANGRPTRESRSGQGRKGNQGRRDTARAEPQPESALAAALKAAVGRK
ncbi:RNA-binding S1 domain-containing protein [Ectothiorhodospira sp. PHS-1]|uniref:Tex family protein n=1 Tax=Ectothiorhodospira sp. PHS-1 TaxID=519989 RepID=UPI00024A85CD|nr:Tex family protein [Ectothiorhodospira sp. PHS-1]EHQ53455.1 RNA-binding S1 domain-containing protein [Ectothiorhodospira sp. PHS-1]